MELVARFAKTGGFVTADCRGVVRENDERYLAGVQFVEGAMDERLDECESYASATQVGINNDMAKPEVASIVSHGVEFAVCDGNRWAGPRIDVISRHVGTRARTFIEYVNTTAVLFPAHDFVGRERPFGAGSQQAEFVFIPHPFANMVCIVRCKCREDKRK